MESGHWACELSVWGLATVAELEHGGDDFWRWMDWKRGPAGSVI